MDWTTAGKARLVRNWLMWSEKVRIASLYRRIAARGGHFAVISDDERELLARTVPRGAISVVPHGVDCGYFTPADAEAEFDVAIFGDMSEARVYEGAIELYTCIQAAAASSPPLKWVFVGKDPAAKVRALRAPSVTVTGTVPDVRPFYSRTRVAVVPTRSGTGVKTTVLQGWAMGKPVVATPFALRGLPARAGENVLVGETPAELAAHVLRLVHSPELAKSVAEAGLSTVRAERDSRRIAETFADLCATVLAGAEDQSR